MSPRQRWCVYSSWCEWGSLVESEWTTSACSVFGKCWRKVGTEHIRCRVFCGSFLRPSATTLFQLWHFVLKALPRLSHLICIPTRWGAPFAVLAAGMSFSLVPFLPGTLELHHLLVESRALRKPLCMTGHACVILPSHLEKQIWVSPPPPPFFGYCSWVTEDSKVMRGTTSCACFSTFSKVHKLCFSFFVVCCGLL